MKSKMMKRYEDGGILEAANQSEESQEIASSMGAGERNTDEPEYKSRSMASSTSSGESAVSEKPDFKSMKEAYAWHRKNKGQGSTFEYEGKKILVKDKMEPRDTGSDVARKAASYPKPALRAETNRDRAERYVAKRAAARAEAAANPARGRSGVMMASGGVAYANGGVVKRATAKSHGKAC
jgi:hypothetical protein